MSASALGRGVGLEVAVIQLQLGCQTHKHLLKGGRADAAATLEGGPHISGVWQGRSIKRVVIRPPKTLHACPGGQQQQQHEARGEQKQTNNTGFAEDLSFLESLSAACRAAGFRALVQLCSTSAS